ncbi:MAG: ABC transporter ATP-binding protein [Methylococcaceae bacterium]
MVEIKDLYFAYPDSTYRMSLHRFHIRPGEKLALTGFSGSGKTTLLKLIAGILSPEQGQVMVAGTHLESLSAAQRRNFRISQMGFIFQELQLLDYLSVLDNILHPYRINRSVRLDWAVRERARQLAEQTGLSNKLNHKPLELSQGEKQRVAVCRALLPMPRLLIADEATSHLDPANKRHILDLLFLAVEHYSASLLVVTHDHDLLPYFDRVVDFTDLVN